MLRKYLIFTAIGFFFLFLPKSTSAQDFSVCESQGFSATGCIKCKPNSADVNVCNVDDNPGTGVGCKAGSTPPDNAAAICGDITDPGQCNAKYIACNPTTVANGAFYCDQDQANPQCHECDNDPNTTIPACPTNLPQYSSQTDCLYSCTLPTTNNGTCVSYGGVCKSGCGGNETELSGTRCPLTGQTCCRVPPQQNGPQCKTAGGKDGVNTAIGCIPFSSVDALTSFALRLGIGVGGGIAFLLIVLAGFQIITSQGDPYKLKAGRDLLTAAIVGILMLIFSVFLLRIIDVNILGIF